MRVALLIALILSLASCDGLGSFDEPDPGAFALRFQGGHGADYAGTALFFANPETPAREGTSVFFGQVELRDAAISQLVASIGLYKNLEEGGGPGDVHEVALYLQVRGGGEWFETSRGSLDVTFVSDTEIVGAFDVDLQCCGSGFSGRPPRQARARGRFHATYAGPFVRWPDRAQQ